MPGGTGFSGLWTMVKHTACLPCPRAAKRAAPSCCKPPIVLLPVPAFPARLRAAMPAACLLLAPVPVCAGGGAHVVDDDAVLDAGTCHAENWVSLVEGGERGLVTIAPACTLRQSPGLELALAVQHLWDEGTAQTVTPGAKLNLRPARSGFGVAVSASATLDLAAGRTETLAVTLPVTVPVTPRLVVHGNLGWIGTPHEADRHALFWGGQAEYLVTRDLVLMGEVFGQDRGPAGAQAGLRWVTDGGRIDVDLLAGHRIDGAAGQSVTFGVTIRR